MNVYIFQADIYCEPCGLAMASHHAPDEDSDRYPQGPYGDGGGESDAPQHCAACCTFLGNALSRDGVEYVRETLARSKPDSVAHRIWAPFYGLES